MDNRPQDEAVEAEFERCRREVETLAGVGRALAASLSLQETLDAILDQVRRLLGPETWSLLLAEEQSGDLHFEVVASPVADRLGSMVIARGEGIAGWVAEHGEPLLIDDVRKDRRFASQCDRKSAFQARSIVCVPLKKGEQVLGVIELVNGLEGRRFGAADLRILSAIADFAAIAIENARQMKQIRKLIISDDLTGLYNARHFHELSDYEIERARRYNTSLALVFIDLDRFKQVNDRYGHLVGSRLLTEVGHLIYRQIRKVNHAARYGGDEFVILCPNTDKAGALVMASHLRQALSEYVFRSDEGERIQITASFGIASYPADAQSKNTLIRLADKAMYEVKGTTRDAVRTA